MDLQNLSTGQEMERWQGSSPVPPVPPPTSTYYGHKSSKGLRRRARFKSNAENESQQAERSMAVRNQPTWDNLQGKEDASGRGHDDASTSGYADSHGVEESPLTDGGGQYSEYEAKRPRHSPAPPAPSPNGIMDMPTPFTNLRRCGRFERMAENISSMHTRQHAYHARVAFVRPLTPLLAPSKRLIQPAGWLWMMDTGYNEVRRARRVETRGHTYRIACILMQLVQDLFVRMKRLRWLAGRSWMMKVHYNEIRDTRKIKMRGHMHRIASILMWLLQILSNPLKRLRSIVNTYWLEGVPTGSMWDDAKWPRNVPMAKWLPCSSGTRQDNEYRAERPNDSPAPSKPTRYDLTHPPGTFRNSHRHARIKTRSKSLTTTRDDENPLERR
ncbi:hypothetical protein F5141DRAFT_1218988 [Pisolithus sp. B1]|nr:hypothetical protein F5141DRAFT_1218988 [Pisolithus sp. B1]